MRCYRFTQVGTAHVRCGLGSDDACVLVRHGDVALAFVSDGMGSAAFGGDAARLCVDAGSRAACATFVPHELMGEESGAVAVRAAFLAAFNEVQKNALSTHRPLSEMQATFMVAILDARKGILQFGYCGDGGLLALLKDGSLAVVVQPQKGENANQTSSVLEQQSWVFGRIDSAAGFMAATDGIFDRMSCAQRDGAIVALPEACRAFAAAFGHMDSAGYAAGADDLFGTTLVGMSPFSSVSDDRTICMVCADDAPISSIRSVRADFSLEHPFFMACSASSSRASEHSDADALFANDESIEWGEFVPLPIAHARKRATSRRLFARFSSHANTALSNGRQIKGGVSEWS